MRTLKTLAACAALVISVVGAAGLVTPASPERSGPTVQISDLVAP
jgi:hypothetical protein